MEKCPTDIGDNSMNTFPSIPTIVSPQPQMACVSKPRATMISKYHSKNPVDRMARRLKKNMSKYGGAQQ
jgi:hypothetical protein